MQTELNILDQAQKKLSTVRDEQDIILNIIHQNGELCSSDLEKCDWPIDNFDLALKSMTKLKILKFKFKDSEKIYELSC